MSVLTAAIVGDTLLTLDCRGARDSEANDNDSWLRGRIGTHPGNMRSSARALNLGRKCTALNFSCAQNCTRTAVVYVICFCNQSRQRSVGAARLVSYPCQISPLRLGADNGSWSGMNGPCKGSVHHALCCHMSSPPQCSRGMLEGTKELFGTARLLAWQAAALQLRGLPPASRRVGPGRTCAGKLINDVCQKCVAPRAEFVW